MPNKKIAPFMIFVKEYRQKFPKLTLEKAISESDKIWRAMTVEEKSLYKNRAKKQPLLTSNSNIPRETYSSQGIPMSMLDKEKENNENEEQTMITEIQNTIITARKSNSLSTQKFYIIMANYFIRSNEGAYLPAEIAICEYSMKDGITNQYHTIINPGDLWFGYAYEAKVHSDSTHNLPAPPNALGENNFSQIYDTLLKFIRGKNSQEEKLPPVFTIDSSVPVLKSILNIFQDLYDYEFESPNIRVYSLHYLFYFLKKNTCEIGEIKYVDSKHITNAILDRDYYEYQSGIACEFHENIDRINFCALSFVIRWAYTLSDNLCMDLGIQMKKGFHVPLNTELNELKKLPDVKDLDEFDSDVSSTVNTNYTQPEFETNCSISFTGEHFPKLNQGAIKKKPKLPNNHNNYSNADVNETITGIENMSINNENRWARLKNYPREPEENSFNITGPSRVTGRGALLTINYSSESENSQDNNVIRSKGRGSLYDELFPSMNIVGRGRPV